VTSHMSCRVSILLVTKHLTYRFIYNWVISLVLGQLVYLFCKWTKIILFTCDILSIDNILYFKIMILKFFIAYLMNHQLTKIKM